MPPERTTTDRRRAGRRRSDEANRSVVDNLLAAIDPLSVVMLSRDRIQETLEEAVERGRMTRSDANALASELLRRGRQQTEELLAEIERLLEGGPAGKITEGVKGLARSADRARRSVTGDADEDLPIADYDELTARQVQARLGDLEDGELRRIAEHERRHGNRKTVLDAIERALG